jgi:hypothetical protein
MPRRLREPPLPAPSWRRRWLPIRSHGPLVTGVDIGCIVFLGAGCGEKFP